MKMCILSRFVLSHTQFWDWPLELQTRLLRRVCNQPIREFVDAGEKFVFHCFYAVYALFWNSYVKKELVHGFSCAYILNYGCTWEVWRAFRKLQLLLATPGTTLTLLSCSPNFPRASIIRYTQAKHEPILKYYLQLSMRNASRALRMESPRRCAVCGWVPMGYVLCREMCAYSW